MKLIWKNKFMWKQKVYDRITGEESKEWFIHPVPAISSIVVIIIAIVLLIRSVM